MFVVFGCEVELEEETIAFESEHVEDEAHAGKQAKINTSKTRQSFPPLYERDSCSGTYRFSASSIIPMDTRI